MSENIPAWKRAIYDRKKQQQKEEELKLAEKEAYLDSLPPWKRALFLKKGKDSGDASTVLQVAKPTAKQKQQQQQPNVISSPAMQPESTAATAVAAWKRKESPMGTDNQATRQQQVNKSTPINTNNNNSGRGASWNTKSFAPAVASPAQTPSQTLTDTPIAVNGTDNLPLWKRNLLQRQSSDKSIQPVNVKVMDTPQAPVAIGSPKIFGKLLNPGTRPHTSGGANNQSSRISRGPVTTNTGPVLTTNDSRSRTTSIGAYDDYSDERLASLPQWKRDLILRKRAASAAAKEKDRHTTEVTEPVTPAVKVTRRASIDKDLGWRKTIKKSPEDVSSSKPPTVRRISDDKISMWQKKAAADQSKVVKRTSQEIDSVKLESTDSQPVQQKGTAQDVIQPVSTQHVSNNIALVNGPEKEENNESAPPILRDKDPWAHLSENDPQFKALPPWKQAMILRRRGDIRRRSNPEMHLDIDSTNANADEDEPDFAEAPAWKREALLKKPAEKAVEDETIPELDDPDMPEWKKEKLRKNLQGKKKSLSMTQSLPVLVAKKGTGMSSYQSDSNVPEWKKEAMRERQSVKNSDDDIPEWKKEAMREKQSVKNSDDDIPEWKKEAMREKQSVKNSDDDIPEWKKEAMREKQSLKKSNSDVPEWKREILKGKDSVEKKDTSAPLLTSIRPLSPDKGNLNPSPTKQYSPQSTDETDYHSANHVDSDEDDDDVPCTNIDDLSDSDESVGGSTSYDVNPESTTSTHAESASSSGYSSDNNNARGMRRQQSSRSILVTRKTSNPQQRQRHRRVSWNDDQMHTEHTYPKYDYADYDELNEEDENNSKGNSVLSHPIHPSLGISGNRSSMNSDSLSNYKPNMVSSYTFTVSTTKTVPTKKEEPKTEPVAMPTEDPEFNMSNLSDDVAALLF